MSVDNFKPSIWSRELLFSLKKDLVGMNLVNQNYQGEITEEGDTVKIISPDSISVGTYDGTDISFETPTSTSQDLPIDQQKYIAFTVDDVDEVQANVSLMDSYMEEANFAVGNDTDTFIFGLYTGADASNVVAESDITASNIYNKITEAKKLLSLNNVPGTGRWLVLSPKEIELLEQSDDFTSASDLGDQTKRTGFAGRIAGFEVFESNNVVETTDVRHCPFGHRMAITFANQIINMEAGRHEAKFADFVKGLHVYGGKVVRSKALGDLRQDVLT